MRERRNSATSIVSIRFYDEKITGLRYSSGVFVLFEAESASFAVRGHIMSDN